MEPRLTKAGNLARKGEKIILEQGRKKPFLRLGIYLLTGLIVLGLLLPVVFRKTLTLSVLNSLKSSLIDEISFSRVDFSLFRSFPYLNVRFTNFSTKGKNKPGNSELFKTRYLDIALDIRYFLDHSRPIAIRTMQLVNPSLQLNISDIGQGNFELPLADKIKGGADSLLSSALPFHVDLESFRIKDGSLNFRDEKTGLLLEANGIDHKSSGELSLQHYNLNTRSRIRDLNIVLGTSKLLSKTRVEAQIDFMVDSRRKQYIIRENKLAINGLFLQVKGILENKANGFYGKMSLFAPENNFAELIRLFPYLDQGQFKLFSKTRGFFSLQLDIDGLFQFYPRLYPSFHGTLLVKNGELAEYPEHSTMEGLNTRVTICNDSDNLSGLDISIPSLEACLGGRDFSMGLYLKDPFFDPYLDGYVRGTFYLENLRPYFPSLKLGEVTGIIKSDFSIKGKMSDAEKNIVQNRDMRGTIAISGLRWKGTTKSRFSVPFLLANFNKGKLQIAPFKARYQNQDFLCRSRIENILAYFSPLRSVQGSLTIEAPEIHLDKILPRDLEIYSGNSADKLAENLSPVKESKTNLQWSPFVWNFTVKSGKIRYGKTTLEDVLLRGTYRENLITLNSSWANYQTVRFQTTGILNNLDSYLKGRGKARANLDLRISGLPFLLPSTDLVEASKKEDGIPNPTPAKEVSGTFKWPQEGKTKKIPSLLPRNWLIDARVHVDSIRSENYAFERVRFRMKLGEKRLTLDRGLAFQRNHPIRWKGVLRPNNSFVVSLDLARFNEELFILPNNSPFRLLQLAPVGKRNPPFGLRISGQLGEPPTFKFYNLDYLFYTQLAPLIEGTQFQSIRDSKKEVSWWISFKDKTFLFWPVLLRLNNIPFYLAGIQHGESECLFKVSAWIPLTFFKGIDLATWKEQLPDGVLTTFYLEGCQPEYLKISFQLHQEKLPRELQMILDLKVRQSIIAEMQKILGPEKWKLKPSPMLESRFNVFPYSHITHEDLLKQRYTKIEDSLKMALRRLN